MSSRDVDASACALTVQVEHIDRAVVVHAAGDIDLTSAGVLAAVLSANVASGQEAVVVDLAKVTFMDSTGVSVLVHAQRALQDESVTLTVEHPAPSVVRVLEITGVADLLGVRTDGDA